MSNFIDYVKDTRGELKHVAWPTKKQAIAFTVLVIAISVIVALILGLFDYILSLVIQKFVL